MVTLTRSFALSFRSLSVERGEMVAVTAAGGLVVVLAVAVMVGE